MKIIPKPDKSEYPEYAEMYMKLLPDDGLILKHLADNFQMVKDFIYTLPPEKLLYEYAKDKWTVKEILVHIVDDAFKTRDLSHLVIENLDGEPVGYVILAGLADTNQSVKQKWKYKIITTR